MDDSSIQHNTPNITAPTAYRHPYPAIRRLDAGLTAVGLALIGIAGAGALALIPFLPAFGLLLAGVAFFSAVIAIPLLMHTVSHPEIIFTSDALIVRPLLWREKSIAYRHLLGLARHPLIRDPGASSGVDRLLWGRNYAPREGVIVIVGRGAGTLRLYRLLGSLAGVRGAAFGLSSTTHRDYAALRARLYALCGDWKG